MTTPLTLPNLLSPDSTTLLLDLLGHAQAENRQQAIAVHDPATGFAVFVEIVAGLPVLWRVTGPMLPAQAGAWFATLTDSMKDQPAPRAN